jgi:hypothetical protein
MDRHQFWKQSSCRDRLPGAPAPVSSIRQSTQLSGGTEPTDVC